MITITQPKNQNVQEYFPLQGNIALDNKQIEIDKCVQQIFDKLNQEPFLLNDLVKEKFKGKEITFMDYIGCVETVYDKFVDIMGLKELKGQSEYVIGEIFDNSGLGHSLFNKLEQSKL